MIRPDLAQRVQDWIAEDMPDDEVADALIRDLWAECLRRNITVVEQRIAKVILDLKREKEAAVLRAARLTEALRARIMALPAVDLVRDPVVPGDDIYVNRRDVLASLAQPAPGDQP